ncbi:hypothetical protein GCM10009642_06490 [Nocardiopsis metallicus]
MFQVGQGEEPAAPGGVRGTPVVVAEAQGNVGEDSGVHTPVRQRALDLLFIEVNRPVPHASDASSRPVTTARCFHGPG